MKILFLKIKLKSLAAEAKIIRQQELKTFTRTPVYIALRDELANHRRWDVRNEARATHLAYGYLRGRRYRQLELTTHSDPMMMEKLFTRAEAMVKKYGPADALVGFRDWTKEPANQPVELAAEVAVAV